MSLGKAWMLDYWEDELLTELIIVHADSEVEAIQRIAEQIGETPDTVTIIAVPAMDGLEANAWNLLTTESCGWCECEGCYRHIYPDGGNAWGRPYTTNDDGEDIPAVPGPRGSAYCSQACLERDQEERKQ